MKNKDFSLKKDKFKSARGGHSRLLNIHCSKCENIVTVYQKDGSGNLHRMYLDRIFAPDNLVGLQTLNINDVPMLKCEKCSQLIGSPYIYPKEKRGAFRLVQDAFVKRLKK